MGMVRDRLPELLTRVEEHGETETETVVEGMGESEMTEEFTAVLTEAKRLHQLVSEISASTNEARRLRADSAYSGDIALQRRLEAVLSRAAAVGAPLCAALQRLTTMSTSADPLSSRVARLHASCGKQSANAALQDHHQLLTELQDRRRKLIRHQLRLLQQPLTGEECERLLEEEEGGGGSAGQVMLFAGDVAAQSAAALSALRMAEERHEDLLQLEGKLKEVNQLFVQLALLVASQQESIDTVEQAASLASKRVDDGQRELLKGHVRKRKTRRKKLLLWLCLSSGVMVVLLVLVLT